MLKDLENGRKTEIDAILGYVLQVAEQTGKEQRINSIPLYNDKRERNDRRGEGSGVTFYQVLWRRW